MTTRRPPKDHTPAITSKLETILCLLHDCRIGNSSKTNDPPFLTPTINKPPTTASKKRKRSLTPPENNTHSLPTRHTVYNPPSAPRKKRKYSSPPHKAPIPQPIFQKDAPKGEESNLLPDATLNASECSTPAPTPFSDLPMVKNLIETYFRARPASPFDLPAIANAPPAVVITLATPTEEKHNLAVQPGLMAEQCNSSGKPHQKLGQDEGRLMVPKPESSKKSRHRLVFEREELMISSQDPETGISTSLALPSRSDDEMVVWVPREGGFGAVVDV